MGMFADLKALWRNRQALSAAKKTILDASEIKRGYKTPAFWATLLGNLVAVAGALKGVITPVQSTVAVAILTAAYNIVRGVKKSQEEAPQSMWKSTEFWMGVAGYVSQAIVAIQSAGVDSKWLVTSGTIIGAGMTIARDFAMNEPTSASVVQTSTTPK